LDPSAKLQKGKLKMIRKTISLIAISGLVLIIGCGGNSTTSESNKSPDSTIAQPTDGYDTWVTNDPIDAFSAPVAQKVCDLMRAWSPPAETSATQVAELDKWAKELEDLIGSPSDSVYSNSYVPILGLALAMLAYEDKYPTNDRFGMSAGFTDTECNSMGMTPENSKFASAD
jgi:hypothetical protein